jgi:hypothetical protein
VLQDEELIAKLPIREADKGVSRGDTIDVGWHAEDARAFAIPE